MVHEPLPNANVWQEIFAADSYFSGIRPITRDNPEYRQLYLRRRCELTRQYSGATFDTNGDESLDNRSSYKVLRGQLLSHLYGTESSPAVSISLETVKPELEASYRRPTSPELSIADSFSVRHCLTIVDPSHQD